MTQLCAAVLRLSSAAQKSKLTVSCALHCGPLLNGIVGSGGPLFAAFGPAVHVAMEMSELVRPGAVLASQAVVRTLMQHQAERYSAKEFKPAGRRVRNETVCNLCTLMEAGCPSTPF